MAAADDKKNDKARDGNADALGYSAYAETLWTRIQRALNQDDPTRPLGDDPLVVGIFGEWGAGKSFLLKQIEALASDYEKGRIVIRKGTGLFDGNAGFGLTVPVYFQPWKYEHEPHLHVPFLLHILEALKRDLAASESIAAKFATKVGAGGDWVKVRMGAAVEKLELLMKGAAIATARRMAASRLRRCWQGRRGCPSCFPIHRRRPLTSPPRIASPTTVARSSICTTT